MQRTIYNTPIIKQIFWVFSWIGIKLSGWKLKGETPKERKYVIIAVPHTSNWDFPITLAMAFLFGFEIYWMGKDSLFKGPAGPIMKWLGGIPVDRSRKTNLVDQMVEQFAKADRLSVTIPPEGTRSKVERWKTGFYHIAVGAQVPIALAYLDYEKKEGGFGPMFYPTGVLEDDLPEIQRFYQPISGKHPDQF